MAKYGVKASGRTAQNVCEYESHKANAPKEAYDAKRIPSNNGAMRYAQICTVVTARFHDGTNFLTMLVIVAIEVVQ